MSKYDCISNNFFRGELFYRLFGLPSFFKTIHGRRNPQKAIFNSGSFPRNMLKAEVYPKMGPLKNFTAKTLKPALNNT